MRVVDERTVQRQLTESALTSDRPSATSAQTLQQLNLYGRFDREPEVVLAAMHDGIESDPIPSDRMFALAELSFLHGTRSGKRSYFLAAAVYAWTFLLPERQEDRVHPLDPRVRLAADIYNRALTLAFRDPESGDLIFEPGQYELPFGVLELDVDPAGFRWGGYELTDFVPVAQFEVRGLRNRYRRPGIGAPLAASVAPLDQTGSGPAGEHWIGTKTKVPVTAFLRLEQPPGALRNGSLRGRLELYAADRTETVQVRGKAVPLETELTATLAYLLVSARLWDLELAGFRTPNLIPEKDQLRMLYPHRRGRVPVVFVHGTASSTARWAQMVNDLQSDPLIRQRCQFWFFSYNTGNPIALSAAQLRTQLSAAVSQLDPEERDTALRQMVLIGHSQGGLLVRLMIASSGDRAWRAISSKPFEQVKLSGEARELLESTLFFEPLAFASRAVFIATPHRGSFIAANQLVGWLVSKVVASPTRIVSTVKQLAALNPEDRVVRTLRVPDSVDNMRPQSRFLSAVREMPISPRVQTHSIIAVQGDGPIEQGDDGVVKYSSAHLEGVTSEKVVHSKHSTQDHPDTIAEVRRILREHLAELGEAAAAGSGVTSPE